MLGRRRHSLLTDADVGSLVRWTVADETSRLALAILTADKYRLAHQTDDGSYWILTDPSGPTWTQLGNVSTPTSSASDPTVNDDELAGNNVGDMWIQTTDDRIYVLVDATAGAAVWVLLGAINVDETEVRLTGGIGTPTIDDVETWRQVTGSVAYVNGGGTITDNGNGTVDVTAGSGFIRSVDSDTSDLHALDWPASSTVALTDNSLNYLYIEYNAGSPQLVVVTAKRTDRNTNIYLGSVYREGIHAHVTQHRTPTGNIASRLTERFNATDGLTRASGSILGEAGTLNLTVTAGEWWHGLDNEHVPALDTSGTDTFEYFYRNGIGGWTWSEVGTIDNANYDDGSGTLATLSANRYGVHWVYVGVDGHLYVIYGQGNYTAAQWSAAPSPPSVPAHMQEQHAGLIGRVVVQQGGSVFEAVESAFEEVFSSAGVTVHSDLSGLAEDDHPQYYNQARGDARYSLLGHTHLEADITDLDKYTQAEVDGLFSGHFIADDHTQYHNDARGDARYKPLVSTGGPGPSTGDGYPEGHVYVDTASNVAYTLVDATPGANVWSHGDHRFLSWLAADDHMQYHTDARGDVRYPRRLDGAGAPGVSTGNGYALGTVYVDTTGDQAYTLVDATTDANVWSAGVTDHGALGGLGDDDHTQYFLAAGTRSLDGLLFAERADHVNAPATGFSEVWLNSAISPPRLMFTNESGIDGTVIVHRTSAPGNNAILTGYGTEGTVDSTTLFTYNSGNGELALAQWAGGPIRMKEGASISVAPGATMGSIWVKNDDPNRLHYYDEASDHTLAYLSELNDGTIDHGSTSGLGDDDHTQYHTDARGDLRYGAIADVATNTSDIADRVVGPGSATDNRIARWDTATGKLLQDSKVALGDNGELIWEALATNAKLEMYERGVGPTLSAGYGKWWVKNDAPTRPKFTDDLGGEVYLDLGATGDAHAAGDGSDHADVATNSARAPLSGASNPGVSTGNGKNVGHIYVDTTNDVGYILADATTDANVWFAGVSDHGGLSGLGDDDHTQYVLADGTRAQDAVFLTDRVDHVNAPAAGKAELWTRTATNYPELMLTDNAGLDWTVGKSYQPAHGEIPYWNVGASGDYMTVHDNLKFDGSAIRLGGSSASLDIDERAAAPVNEAGIGKLWANSAHGARPYWTEDGTVDRPVVCGPNGIGSTVTDNAIARYDNTSGGALLNSGIRIDDSGNLVFDTLSSFIQMEANRTVPPSGSAGHGRVWAMADNTSGSNGTQSLWFTNDNSYDQRLGQQCINISFEISPGTLGYWFGWTTAGPYNDTIWSQNWGTGSTPTIGNLTSFPPLAVLPGDARVERVIGWYTGESTTASYQMELAALLFQDQDTYASIGRDTICDGSVNGNEIVVANTKVAVVDHIVNDNTIEPTDTAHAAGLYMCFRETTSTKTGADLRGAVSIYYSTLTPDGWYNSTI